MGLSMMALAGRSAHNLTETQGIQSLTPLPKHFRDGMISITVLACLSFVLTTSLWVYLNYRLISWRLGLSSRARAVADNIPNPPCPLPDLHFEASAFGPQGQNAKTTLHERSLRQIRDAKNEESPNQFLVLIYNLFLADMHQSAAFLLSARWLGLNGIFVNRPTCFIQGYFDSNGDLASSCFFTFIAIHTYLGVVKGYQPPHKILYLFMGLIWLFVYSMSTIPLLVTHNGRDVGGYFVRAGAWVRIYHHYFPHSISPSKP